MAAPSRGSLKSLIDADRIAARVYEMAQEIARDYEGLDPVLVCVLKGAMPFFVDLTRSIESPVRLDYIAVESYRGTRSSGAVTIKSEMSLPARGEHLVIVEDIVDTGLTIRALTEALAGRNAASVAVAALLDKPSRREVDVSVRYRGFEIPDSFVVGYGLDYEQRYRNLPFIAEFDPPVE